MTRNIFENHDGVYQPQEGDDSDIETLGGKMGPHVMLPPLAEGFSYELQELPSGNTAVIVTGEAEVLEPEDKTCGCGPYQGCATCGKYQGDGLNSSDSRTLRHRD